MLSKYLSHENIILNLQSSEREEAFAELLEVIVKQNPGINRDLALDALITREEKMSTAVLPSIAVPHATYDFSIITKPESQSQIESETGNSLIAMGISRRGIEFDSAKDEMHTADSSPLVKVNIIIEILFDENDAQGHLHLLRDILKVVSDKDFYSTVMSAASVQDILDYIHEVDV